MIAHPGSSKHSPIGSLSAPQAACATSRVSGLLRPPTTDRQLRPSLRRQPIRNALDVADPSCDPTLSAGSLRVLAAAPHFTSLDTLPHAAQILGVEPMALHRVDGT